MGVVGCGDTVMAVHDTTMRRIRDLPVWDAQVELGCRACGFYVHAAASGWST